MCGITGILARSDLGRQWQANLSAAVATLAQRGPDNQSEQHFGHLSLGHARLSIFDPSAAAHQPMSDPTGRYTIVFNGEFYNFKEHRAALEQKGVTFHTTSDTEVLLHLYIHEGEAVLEKINGFFALAIYDREEDDLFLARDRMGIKPLLVFEDENAFAFASELKALIAYGIPRELDMASLFTYLHLNYVPGPATMLQNVRKVEPGHCLRVTGLQSDEYKVTERAFYEIPYDPANYRTDSPADYESAQKELVDRLENAVVKRLAADVPVGTFLSGGIDSSVITALASRNASEVNTFSIGFTDNPFFDETEYAELVAKKCGTRHTVFSLRQRDLVEHLHDVLDYLDEPFADSSAVAVYILSQLTRQHVTVALSGDGADELFSGYNKHAAELKAREPNLAAQVVKGLAPVWSALPQSRNSKIGNLNRQLHRFASGMKLSPKDRYWRWAGFLDEEKANYLLAEKKAAGDDKYGLSEAARHYHQRRDSILRHLNPDGDINEVLYTDMQLVLPYDMLTKVDSMSMANSLEVRTPFLDHNVVDWAFTLPPSYKINPSMRKRIVQDAFRSVLPEQLYDRPKKGFEIPLLSWFQGSLKHMITHDLLADDFVAGQGIFNVSAIRELKAQLFSSNPGDATATIWALIVFQYWWKKYMS